MLLSSLAESVYWFGRYIERTENTARLILVNDSLLLDLPAHCSLGWTPIIEITGGRNAFLQHHDPADEHSAVRFLLVDCDNNPGALLNSIERARENLRTTRSLFPNPVWEAVNDLYAYVKEHHVSALTRQRRYKFLRHVIDGCHLIAGKIAVTTSHDDIYEFVRMGFNLERADMTSRVIDIRAGDRFQTSSEGLLPFEDIQWKSVLDSLAGWQMYRRYAHIRVSGVDVLRFLLQDRQFPRAIHHCLAQLEQSLYLLAVNDAPRGALLQTRRKLRDMRIEKIMGEPLHRHIDELQKGFNSIHTELSQRYFENRSVLATRAGNRAPTRAAKSGTGAVAAAVAAAPPTERLTADPA